MLIPSVHGRELHLRNRHVVGILVRSSMVHRIHMDVVVSHRSVVVHNVVMGGVVEVNGGSELSASEGASGREVHIVVGPVRSIRVEVNLTVSRSAERVRHGSTVMSHINVRGVLVAATARIHRGGEGTMSMHSGSTVVDHTGVGVGTDTPVRDSGGGGGEVLLHATRADADVLPHRGLDLRAEELSAEPRTHRNLLQLGLPNNVVHLMSASGHHHVLSVHVDILSQMGNVLNMSVVNVSMGVDVSMMVNMRMHVNVGRHIHMPVSRGVHRAMSGHSTVKGHFKA